MELLKLVEKDRQALQALVRLRNDPALLKLFEKLAEESMKSLVRAPDDIVFRRLQGRAMLLEEIQEAAQKAASVLERLPAAR